MKLFGKDKSATATSDSSDVATEAADSEGTSPGQTAGKGRPTPKRRDAQPRRSGPVAPPPQTRREAMKRMRTQSADKRAVVRDAQLRGDERYLPKRDAGPVRKLVRDIVDTRRNVASIFMFVALIVILGYFIPDPRVQSYTVLFWMLVFLAIIFDSIRLGRTISKLVKERFPKHEDRMRSLVWYGISRSTMIRKWRFPKATKKLGDEI